MKPWIFVLSGCLGLGSACSSEEDEEQSKPELELTANNIKTVADNMVPGSLVVETDSSLALNDNPCADTDGFFDCQPNLIKLYLDIGKHMVQNTAEIVGALSQVAGFLENGKGSHTGENGVTVDYNISAGDNFKMLFSAGEQPYLFLEANGGEYDLRFDSSLDPQSTDETDGKINTKINFTDDNNFNVNLSFHGIDCDPSDVRAPAAISIDIVMVEGVAQGKSMMYMPRWVGDELTCESEPTSSSKIFLYTDFVGDDEKTTAALYLLNDSVEDISLLSDWEIADFCTNFNELCFEGRSLGDANVIADSYQNNFCFTKDSLSWGQTCESDNSVISTPQFSSADKWLTPNGLATYALEFPGTVD